MDTIVSPNPLRDLFDAAVRHSCIRLSCRTCGHTRIFDPHGLWWLFQQRGWTSSLQDVPKRFWCSQCALTSRRKTKYPRLELVSDDPTGTPLPMPPMDVWKKTLRRRR